MKKVIQSILAIVLIASTAYSSGEHAKVIPGPNGGRIVELEGGHAELFVQPDKKVKVTFYSEDMKPVAPVEQAVSLIAEAPSGKAKLGFEKSSDGFISKEALPDGDGYRLVLQIRTDAEAKSQNFRIDYHTEVCGKCNRADYACICVEEGGDHSSHGH